MDNLKQFYELVGNLELFAPRSRVIVTTRDEHVLIKLGVHGKYKVEELGEEESLQLLSLNGLRRALSKRILLGTFNSCSELLQWSSIGS